MNGKSTVIGQSFVQIEPDNLLGPTTLDLKCERTSGRSQIQDPVAGEVVPSEVIVITSPQVPCPGLESQTGKIDRVVDWQSSIPGSVAGGSAKGLSRRAMVI